MRKIGTPQICNVHLFLLRLFSFFFISRGEIKLERLCPCKYLVLENFLLYCGFMICSVFFGKNVICVCLANDDTIPIHVSPDGECVHVKYKPWSQWPLLMLYDAVCTTEMVQKAFIRHL